VEAWNSAKGVGRNWALRIISKVGERGNPYKNEKKHTMHILSFTWGGGQEEPKRKLEQKRGGEEKKTRKKKKKKEGPWQTMGGHRSRRLINQRETNQKRKEKQPEGEGECVPGGTVVFQGY